jgi:hypothetical protein
MLTPDNTTAIKNALQAVSWAIDLLDKLTDHVIQIRVEQGELRDEVLALSNRIENVTHAVTDCATLQDLDNLRVELQEHAA